MKTGAVSAAVVLAASTLLLASPDDPAPGSTWTWVSTSPKAGVLVPPAGQTVSAEITWSEKDVPVDTADFEVVVHGVPATIEATSECIFDARKPNWARLEGEFRVDPPLPEGTPISLIFRFRPASDGGSTFTASRTIGLKIGSQPNNG